MTDLFVYRQVYDKNGIEFGGYNIPKDMGICIPVKWLHFGENSWINSLEFDPKRFDKSDGRTKTDRGDIGMYNNVPFALGLHKCLGVHLALNEIRVYTTLLLRDWTFEVDETKLKDSEGVINEFNLTEGFTHKNMYIKLSPR